MNEPNSQSLDMIISKESIKEHDANAAREIYDRIHEQFDEDENFDYENIESNERIFLQFVRAHPGPEADMLNNDYEISSHSSINYA